MRIRAIPLAFWYLSAARLAASNMIFSADVVKYLLRRPVLKLEVWHWQLDPAYADSCVGEEKEQIDLKKHGGSDTEVYLRSMNKRSV
ncbi:hypothetical protein BC629DRAFT_558901 [Irpex lacteus]|nr:hypothetical protein BC629DRAFT_558901 [Irpex lacteus]